MEQRIAVAIYTHDEKRFQLVVEPPTAIESLRNYLKAQTDEVVLYEPLALGDIGVRLINGKSIEEVLGARVIVTGEY